MMRTPSGTSFQSLNHLTTINSASHLALVEIAHNALSQGVTIDIIPVTYGYARVSKADDDSKNLETQLRELDVHGIRRDLVFTEEGVAIQADLTRRDIAIVAIREQIDTREGSAAANFFRRAMLAQGAYQVESASERIRMGLDWARASGKRIGRPPALSPEQVDQCRRMAEGGAGLRQIARVLKCSPATVRKALLAENGHVPGPAAAQDLGE